MAGRQKKETLMPEDRLQAALVPESEQPYPVPENWCWTYLTKGTAECLDSFRKPINASERANREGNIPYYGATGQVGWIDDFLTNEQLVLVGEDGAPFLDLIKDKAYIIEGKAWVNNHAHILRSRFGTVGNLFLMHYLNIFNYHDFVNGTTRLKLTQGSMDTMPVPVPPLSEQLRIVDRIESLFAKLDEAKQRAQNMLDSFETRRAAILHKAFTGELTTQWRKEHGVGMEGWDRLQWGSFIVSIEAGKNWSAEGRPPRNDEFGIVKVSAVTWGEFNEVESKTCTVEEQWNENIQIHEGDFLFSRANTLQLVGNCVIVKSISRRLMLSDKILRFKFAKRVIPDYVLYFTKSNLYRNQIEQLASGNQDGMRNVSQKNMRLVEFPIPKLEEQKEIVRILSKLLAKEQQAKEAAEGVLEQIGLIKKAILKPAQLVSKHGERIQLLRLMILPAALRTTGSVSGQRTL